MRVLRFMEAPQEPIKSITNLLECVFHRIIWRNSRFVDCRSEQMHQARVADDAQRLAVCAYSIDFINTPPMLFSSQNISPPKFQGLRAVRPNSLSNLVKPCREPMGLSLKNCKSGEDDMAVSRIRYGARNHPNIRDTSRPKGGRVRYKEPQRPTTAGLPTADCQNRGPAKSYQEESSKWLPEVLEELKS